MPDIDVQVAWVVPVDPVELCARLTAYVNLLPAITALRLCNTFGKGDEAFVTQLPKELIDRIATELLKEEGDNKLAQCVPQYKCFTDQCQETDHFARNRLQQIYNVVFPREKIVGERGLTTVEKHRLNSKMKSNHDDRFWGMCSEVYDEKTNDYYSRGITLDGWSHIHEARRSLWLQKVGNGGTHLTSPMLRHNDMLRKHFGVTVWFSNSEVGAPGRVQHRSTAYLMLPNQHKVDEVFYPESTEKSPCYWDGELRGVDVFDGSYNRTLALPTPLPWTEKRKFKCALLSLSMKQLDQETSLYLAARDTDVKDLTSSSTQDDTLPEPVLKVLVKLQGEHHLFEVE